MAKGNMTIRMEPELKAQAAALFKSLGMDLSTATGIFYRQALRCHGLPFEVKVDEPNAVTYAAMEAAEKGEDMYGPFDSVADLMEALNAIKRGCDPKKLEEVITLLCNEQPLAEAYRDHALTNSRNYKDMRECHIEPDWLLVYKVVRQTLILKLIRTGSHSDLF